MGVKEYYGAHSARFEKVMAHAAGLGHKGGPPFDLSSNVQVVIHEYPDGRVHGTIPSFLTKQGYPWLQHVWTIVSPQACAFNEGLWQIRESGKEWGMVIEADAKLLPTKNCPDVDLSRWLEALQAGHPVVVASYDTPKGDQSWNHPQAFHALCYGIHRSVIEAIEPPWFDLDLTDDGRHQQRCCCEVFRDKMIAAGYRIVRAGRAGHHPVKG